MENKLGNFLREKRGKISLRDFANKLKISHTYLDSLEKGFDPRTKKPVRITVDTLSEIAEALNEPFEKLAAYSKNKDYTPSQLNTDKINIGLSIKDYNPPTEEQKKKIEEFAKFVLQENKKNKEEK